MQCEHKKRDGRRCGARPLTGQNRCAIHAQPGRAAELGGRGRRRAAYSPGALKGSAAPKTAADLRDRCVATVLPTELFLFTSLTRKLRPEWLTSPKTFSDC